MGDTLRKVAIQVIRENCDLWDKAQIIVALSRTKLGKDIIFVGNMEETINSIIELIQTRNQWTDYMEIILNLVTLKIPSEEETNNVMIPPLLTTETFPYRICDIALPQCKSGFVYFLISVRTRNFTYIGECKCIISRLRNHNSGYVSASTAPEK